MKKAFLIFCLFLSIFGYINPVKGQDSIVFAKKEILTLKPLPYNKQTFNDFKKQRFYDYYKTKIQAKSIFEILHERFNNWFSRVFKKTLDRNEFNTLMWIVGLLIIVVFGVIIYMNKPGIFYFNKKNPLTYSIEDENIETYDLDYLTENSINEKNFSDAIRWQYLKTLKILHESDYISYDSNKTVNEYVYEIKDLNLRKEFRNLSGEFIYYRYGKGEADAEKFSGFLSAAKNIQKIRTV